MNKHLLFMFAGALFTLASVGTVYVLFFRHDSPAGLATKEKKNGKAYRIALMIPTSHQALNRIVQGFVETFESELPLAYTLFNAHANRSLMKAQAEEIVSQSYDLICTIGAATSLMAQETIIQRNAVLPLVFTAVTNPEKIGLKKDTAGVTEQHDYTKQIDWLLFLKPGIRRMLLVYDPTQGSGLQPDHDSLAALCKQRGIILDSVVITNPRDIYPKVAAVLDNHEVVLVLKDNTVVSGIEALIELCNKKGSTLFVSNLDSVDKGAALGYGVHEYDFGAIAARKAIALVTHKKLDAPITGLDDYYVKINTKTMGPQGLTLDPRHLFLLTHGESL